MIFYSTGLGFKAKGNAGEDCGFLSKFGISPLKWKWDLFSCKIARKAFPLWHLRIYQMRFSIDPSGRDECPERINEPPL